MGGCSSCSLHPLLQDAAAAQSQAACHSDHESVRSDPPDVTTCTSDTTGSSGSELTTSSSPAGSASGNSSSGGHLSLDRPDAPSSDVASLSSLPAESTDNLLWLPVPVACGCEGGAAGDGKKHCGGTAAACQSVSLRSAELAQDTSRVALQATLEQICGLPFEEFTRGPPPSMVGRGRSSPRGGDANFGLLEEDSSLPVVDMLSAAVRDAGVDTAILTINSKRRVWIHNNEGFRPGNFPWCWSAWQTRAPAPQLLVVTDTLKIDRLRELVKARPSAPHVRFFAGTPLVAEDGLVIGSLSLIGREPRSPSAAQCAAFAAVAAWVSAEVGRDLAARQRLLEQLDHTVHSCDLDVHIRESLEGMSGRAVLYVEVAQHEWQAKFANAMFVQVVGVAHDAIVSMPLWSIFRRPFDDSSEAWQASLEVAARGDEFVIRAVQIAAEPERGTFSLHFRPADQGGLDDDAELVGLPAQMPSAVGDAGHPYFVLVSAEAGDGGPGQQYTPVQALNAACGNPLNAVAIEGLQLGPLLGRGSFGNVYRGRYRGRTVAVKVCTGSLKAARGKTQKPWRNMEATQVRKLRHPNIVNALKHTTVLVQDGNVRASSWSKSSGGRISGRSRRGSQSADSGGRGSGSGGRGSSDSCGGSGGSSEGADESASWSEDSCEESPAVEMETILVMEYCNKGTLKSGIDRGYFCTSPAPGQLSPGDAPRPANMPVVMAVAAEIADALAYLHERRIVHGDLCATNVLLTSDKRVKPHGFTSKIADFGMSRELKMQQVQTASYGTVTHMPPELMLEQQLSASSDVFAYGVLLWELAMSRHAWEGMSHTQVIAAVTIQKRRLEFPGDAHPGLADLSRRCTEHNPLQRPTFVGIQDEIARLQAGCRREMMAKCEPSQP